MLDFVPRAVCARCQRPESVCLCAHLCPIVTRTHVVILQHPREAWVPIGTARLAELGLVNAERHVGVDFAGDFAVEGALRRPSAPPILLSPGPGARDLALDPPAGDVTLVVLDGTWWQAAKLLKRNAFLASLPRYTLNPASPSRYRIRREPAAHCMSTIEAIAQALTLLEPETAGIERLLDPFDALVSTQLEYIARGRTRHVKKARAPRRLEPIVPAERARDLVVGYGEANAWPRGSALGDSPEIVHWVAERVVTGERFEAFIAPRHPISPSFTFHTEVSAECIAAGLSPEAFRRRWEAFLRPTDVLAGWGFYASQLLRDRGVSIPERIDVRAVAHRRLGRKPGEMLECAASLGSRPEPAWAAGRAGRRIAAIAAVARALLA